MVAMAALCGTRIRYFCLLIQLVGGDLAGGIEESGDSSGHHFYGVVDLVYVFYKFGIRSFGSIQEVNDDDFGSRALVLRGTARV
jgi:hypothetical protein